uniref:Putative secreted protein n=1 Tax=Anopheles marajoara TaxID=58244 RepID=A0A2M4CCF7_9DIPT
MILAGRSTKWSPLLLLIASGCDSKQDVLLLGASLYKRAFFDIIFGHIICIEIKFLLTNHNECRQKGFKFLSVHRVSF